MPDPKFFSKTDNVTLCQLVEHAELEPHENLYEPGLEITGIAPLNKAGPNDLAFLDNIRYIDDFSKTEAGACIIHPEHVDKAPENVCLLLSQKPYRSYALAARFLYPEPWPEPEISSHAHIHPSVKIGSHTHIEPGVIIGKGVEIGQRCWIEASAVIRPNVRIGDGCRIGANSTISHSVLENHIRVYPGCQIGQDGFGFAMDQAGFTKVPQLGRVIIKDGVEIGANTTIDRGTGPDTIIGEGTWIDNLVQIGHNVEIGRLCVIVAQVGVSGSAHIKDYVALGGQAGIAGHLTIGQGARIAAQSGVMRDVPAQSEYVGSPAQPMKSFMKQVAYLKKLVKNKGKIKV